MEKRKLYPIGKAAEICKVSPRALRYYEEKGLIRPMRSAAVITGITPRKLYGSYSLFATISTKASACRKQKNC